MDRFYGRVVVVTGAGSGIGAAAADRLLAGGAHVVLAGWGADREGANVVWADWDADRLSAVPATPSVLTVLADVSDPRAVEELVDATLARFGHVDVVVSNAGIWRGSPFLDITDEEWDAVLGVNLK